MVRAFIFLEHRRLGSDESASPQSESTETSQASSIACDNLLILVKRKVVYRLKDIDHDHVDAALSIARSEANMSQFATQSV